MTGPTDETRDEAAQAFLRQVRARLDEGLAQAAQAADTAMRGLEPSPLEQAASLEGAVRRLVDAGGKLVRPRLVRLGYLAAQHEHRAAGTVPVACPDDVVRLAAAFELLHVFGLLQDDVMDASTTRRGFPTAHRLVATAVPLGAHADADTAARGSAAARVGESIAVLAGDLAFALAGRLVRNLPEPALRAWDATVIELVQGQRLDLVFAAEARLDAVSTLRVAHAKSGAYTVQRPLEAGALLTGLAAAPSWLTTYGEALGEVFALVDDVIGLWGDPAVTGKPAGEDLRERKPSTVIGIADDVLDGALSRRLAPGSAPVESAEVTQWLTRFEQAGVRAEAARRIAVARERAVTALDALAPSPVRDELTRFAEEISTRDC